MVVLKNGTLLKMQVVPLFQKLFNVFFVFNVILKTLNLIKSKISGFRFLQKIFETKI